MWFNPTNGNTQHYGDNELPLLRGTNSLATLVKLSAHSGITTLHTEGSRQ